MRKTSLLHATVAALALWAGAAVQAQTYSNAVATMNPAPVGYWPLQETTPPPSPGSLNLTAHNSGTLGSAGDGLYGAWYQANGASWYLTNNVVLTNAQYTHDGSQALLCQSVYTTYVPGQYVVVPHTTNGVANDALTIKAPFSVECWAYIGSTNGVARALVAQGSTRTDCGGSDTNNPFNGGTFLGFAGFELGQYRDYIFFMPMCTNGYAKPELDMPPGWNNGVNGAGLKVGTLLHIVATYATDGTKTIYTNGVLCVSGGTQANGAGIKYVPDPISPIMIGAGPEVSVSRVVPSDPPYAPYSGVLDDVAIYPTVLTVNQAMAHYQAAANGTYSAAVLGDSPTFYYRFDDTIAPANAGYNTASFPTANNYGVAGATANGLYQPGTTPGVAGPSYSGFGPSSKAVAFNGVFGTVNIGNGNLPASLNPTGVAPLTVACWFKGGPADAPNRFQEIVGHSDSSYRLALGQAAGDNHFNAGPGPEVQFDNIADETTNGFALNDGKWHMVAGVSDGTHEYLYLDGRLAKSATNNSGINIVGTLNDLVIGGDPQYTYASGASENTIRNFDGSVAHVAFWTNALTTTQIQSLYGAAGVPPTIAQQPPATLTVNAGTALSVPVQAYGSSPLSYQWYKNGNPLSSQTTSALTFPSVQLGDAGTYYVKVSNTAGTLNSINMALTVNGPPFVQQQSPTDVKVFVGTHPVLRATAGGPGPFTYQWNKGGTAISGATGSSYLPDTSATSSSSYGCTIINGYGQVSISPITVQVLAKPTADYPKAVLADNPAYYFRLNEAGDQFSSVSGVTAYDYAGGLNAIYTNATLGNPGYSSTTDPTETSAGFGYFTPTLDSYAGRVSTYLNFAQPSGNNAQFSVEAWYNATYPPSTDAGIVAIGYGWGGEQFALDCGGGNLPAGPRAVRFIVNYANGGGTSVAALNTTNFWGDGKWHHVVGVCDEANSKASIYVDGALQGSVSVTPGAGLQALTSPLAIGARLYDSKATFYTNQFTGFIDDVALYNTALSAAQVANHYGASGTAPAIVQAPPSTIVTNEGATVVLTATVTGTQPLNYQWSVNGSPISGATSSNLTLANVTASMSGNNYSLQVDNSYGSANTLDNGGTVLTVNYGPPTFTANVSPLNASNYVGGSFTYSVVVDGSLPFSYQWYRNGQAISGANSSSYTFSVLSGVNTYYVHVTNGRGVADSATATMTGVASPTLDPTAYAYKAKITFAGYNRSEVLADFPALVVLTNIPGFAYSQLAAPNGGDLRFTDAGGTHELPYQIDQWDPAGNSTVWVQVPRLGTNTDAIIAYWGNAAATTPEAWTTNGAVWVPQTWEGVPAYTAVYHLKESGFPYADSTTLYPFTTGVAPTLGAGIVGMGQVMNASTLDAGQVTLSNPFTVSAWVKVASSATSIQMVWANSKGGSTSAGFRFYVNNWNTQNGALVLEVGNGTAGSQVNTAAGAVPVGQWHLVSAILNTNTSTAQLAVDGAILASGTIKNDFPLTSDTVLGRLAYGDGSFPFTGTMDEARIRAGACSANWLWADYMTVAQNTTFESYGAVDGPVLISVQKLSDGSLQLSWPRGTLLAAPAPTGPWHDVTTVSPYTTPTSGSAQFFRVRVQP